MLDWRVLAISVPLLFASYQSLSKLLPKDTSVFLVNAYASLMGLIIMLSFHMITQTDKSVRLSGKYLLLALGIGTLISFGNWGIIKAFSLGAPQSSFSLFFYITLIIYGTIFGLLFWNEKLNIIQALGMALSILGVFLVVYFKK